MFKDLLFQLISRSSEVWYNVCSFLKVLIFPPRIRFTNRKFLQIESVNDSLGFELGVACRVPSIVFHFLFTE